MRQLRNLFLLMPLLLLLTCSRDIIEFDVEHQTTFTVESSINSPISFPTPQIETNSEQTFENHDTRAELVEDVRLEQLSLKIIDPKDETFSFLDEIHIYINTEGEQETEIAYKENISDKIGDSLTLEITGHQLDPYLKAEQYTIRTETTTDETLAQDIKIRAHMLFHVKAKKELF